MDHIAISEESTITIGLLLGSIGTLVAATAAFVNLRRDVRELTRRMEQMATRSEINLAFMRLARDNPSLSLKVPELEEQTT